jgi:uncharacterized protein DUF433
VFDRITFDSRILGGRACIRGMRIPVSSSWGRSPTERPGMRCCKVIPTWNATTFSKRSNTPPA